jgi:hypothetical protein
MSRTFQDSNFLTWDAFASTGKQGFTNDPHLVFQCTTRPESRPRWLKVTGDEATAQAMLLNASNEEVLAWFAQSEELP